MDRCALHEAFDQLVVATVARFWVLWNILESAALSAG